MVVLLLGLVIATVFFSITKLSSELPAYMANASQQATTDLSTPQESETSAQIQQVALAVSPIAQGLLASAATLLVQFRLALAIFFFMISATLSLPTPSRLGLDTSLPTIGRVAALTEDVRKYMTVLTGVSAGRDWRDPGGTDDPASVDHHGKFRGHPHTGDIDALHGRVKERREERSCQVCQGFVGESERHFWYWW
ncbi:MAG: hypothetical protein A2Z16_13000 [Chloroflexi bacterium RBG_16_54_18]|nr:MAG: hypothetical protein A2Z16_13000 [Chloroflexi bacterium RBG_16_54_18]